MIIRVARAIDKAPVIDFCNQIWPSGDYLPETFDMWLEARNGRLLVATVKGAPVGEAHAYLQSPSVLWLEGIRVHPLYQGRGIGGKLNVALCDYGIRKGAQIARLCTGSSNVASRKHAEKVGFRLLQRFQRFYSERGLKRNPGTVRAARNYRPALWKWILNRPEASQFKSTYSTGWTWRPLTRDRFRTLARSRRVLLTRRQGTMSSCGIISQEDRRVTLGFIVGALEGVEAQAKFLRYMLTRKKYEKARVVVPVGSDLAEAIEDAGFAKSGKILLYERELQLS